MLVNEIMSTDVITVDIDATVSEADALMREHDLTFLPVIHEEVTAGVITRQNIDASVRQAGRDPDEVRVGEVLSPATGEASPRDLGANERVAAISQQASVEEAAQRMEAFNVRRLAVHDTDYQIVGIVSQSDLHDVAAPHSHRVEPAPLGVEE